jgi:clan AA aspartic protease
MIPGTVNSRHEILIRVTVRTAAGQEQEIEAVLDTGFTGLLILPPATIAGLGLRRRSRSYAVLANGNVEQFDVYATTVIWDGRPRRILIYSVDTAPLLGMTLLIGHELRAQVVAGGIAEISPIP